MPQLIEVAFEVFNNRNLAEEEDRVHHRNRHNKAQTYILLLWVVFCNPKVTPGSLKAWKLVNDEVTTIKGPALNASRLGTGLESAPGSPPGPCLICEQATVNMPLGSRLVPKGKGNILPWDDTDPRLRKPGIQMAPSKKYIPVTNLEFWVTLPLAGTNIDF